MELSPEVGSFSVADVMRTDIFTLTPQTPVIAARRLAMENRIDHLLVLEGGTLAGIVCREDLASRDKDALVGDCMSTPVLCVAPDTSIDDAAEIMLEQGVSCLPVVIGSSLIGIITRAALEGMGCTRPSRLAGEVFCLTGEESGGVAFDGWDLETCSACGGDHQVREDSRLSGVLLCGRCVGKAVPRARGQGTS